MRTDSASGRNEFENNDKAVKKEHWQKYKFRKEKWRDSADMRDETRFAICDTEMNFFVGF